MGNIDFSHSNVILRLFNFSIKSTGLFSGLESPNALIVKDIVDLFQGLTACFLEQEENMNGSTDAESAEDTVNLEFVSIYSILLGSLFSPSTECSGMLVV